MSNRHLIDIDAEQAVLGACLINQDALMRVISTGITSEDFVQHEHCVLWQAMVDMQSSGMKIDAITIGEHLARTRKDWSGKLTYAIELANSTPGANNAEAYADIILECSTARKVSNAGKQIVALAEKGTEALIQANKLIQQIQPMKAETLTTISSCAIEFLDDLQQAYENGNNRLKTGIVVLDKMLGGGLEPGFYFICARPSMGKTALALQILINLSVVQRLRTMFFSLEMPRKIVMQRAASNIARIPFDRIRDPKPVFEGRNQIGGLLDEDWPKITASMTKIKGSPLIISDGAKQSAAKIVAQAQRAHQKGPLSAVVVDHSLLMHFPGAKDEGTRRLALSDAMKEFVALSKPDQLNCPIILLHQLNRDNEKRSDKRPIMSDLAASGAAEQDADYILAPHRDSYYESGGASASGLAEIILMKGRNTPTGAVPVDWEGQYQNFGEWKGQWPIKKKEESSGYKPYGKNRY